MRRPQLKTFATTQQSVPMNSTGMKNFKRVMDEVYGVYTPTSWKPRPYAEGKGRYLWTDAFGVCNYITLFHETGDPHHLDQADALINEVHNILGKDRSLSKRLGSATDSEPLKGGLRIGKKDPEGTPDGDGQYFHYLTKWMFALNRMSIARNEPRYNQLAIQLAEAIHPHFVHKDSSRPRKISVDMSHPVVGSEGNLDPFDGYMTYRILQDSSPNKDVLKNEINDMRVMVEGKFSSYRSSDPLDLGEALWYSSFLFVYKRITHWYADEPWAKLIATRSLNSLEKLYQRGYFDAPSQYRLAFREFGTTIGVKVNPLAGKEWLQRAEDLNSYWERNLYSRDRDITPVMFCTSLMPGVFRRGYPSTTSL